MRQEKSGGLRKSSEYWSSQAPRMEEMVLWEGGKHRQRESGARRNLCAAPGAALGQQRASIRAGTLTSSAPSSHPQCAWRGPHSPARGVCHTWWGRGEAVRILHSEQPLLPPHHPQLCQGVRMKQCPAPLPLSQPPHFKKREAASTGHLTARAPGICVLPALSQNFMLMELGEATKPPRHCSRSCWGFPGHPQLHFGAQGSLTC